MGAEPGSVVWPAHPLPCLNFLLLRWSTWPTTNPPYNVSKVVWGVGTSSSIQQGLPLAWHRWLIMEEATLVALLLITSYVEQVANLWGTDSASDCDFRAKLSFGVQTSFSGVSSSSPL